MFKYLQNIKIKNTIEFYYPCDFFYHSGKVLVLIKYERVTHIH